VGERVEKQVEKALAQLSVVSESDAANNKQDLSGSDHTVTGKAKGDQVNENMDGPASNASSIYADWEEAADAKDPPKKASKFIKVFSLPMKPFVSIDIMPLEEKPVEIPEDKVVHVARMKKEFDQIDRNLVMCTPKFIAYALKAGGFRLIRQDSGKYKQLYSTFEERVFNLSGCTSKSGFGMRESETILGTGIKGTVFWAPLAYFGSERDVTIGAMNDGDRGFIFPPVPATDENTSGGQLKTRVKASSRTPDIFAYGRGKTIHIVWPIVARTSAYTNPETKICDSKKYLHDDQLKISTGKAAKDFAFSADDTVIASLDKSGKLKFWDIRALTKPEYNSEFRAGIVMDISTPIMVLNTNIPSEKSWPTSVMFVDKEKPMAKGLALRYMIVGMKQNHTVQLWDLGLGKPVQEINFPHDDESDAICSLAFHPRTGILAVGHPTRNSIYLLHVSPPKYTLSPMGQHKYMNMVVAKEKSLPVPNSTVIVSSIREYTMENRGQLRSLDLMHEAPNASMATDDGLNIHGDQLMTLIIMHSKGIFEFRLSREHLGWSSDGKTLNSSDALKSKAIVLGELRQPPLDNGSVNDDTGSIAASKGEAGSSVSVEHTPKTSKPDVAKATASAEKEKKKKKKAEDTAPPSPAPVSTSASALEEVRKVQRAAKPSFVPDQLPSRVVESTAPKTNGVAVTDEDIKRVTVAMSADFTRVLNEQFSILYNRISGDKRALEATAAAKQDAILRLVSKTLSENVESALGKIVMDGLATSIEPLKDVVSTTIDRTVTTVLANSMKSTIPREVEKLLPAVISKVLQDTNIHRSIADGVSKDISTSVNSSVTAAFGSIAPTIQAVAGSSAQQLAVEVERRISEQMRAAAAQHQKDSADIESLKHQVSTLTTAIHGMVEQQMKFQVDMRNLMQTSVQAQAQAQAQAQRAQPVHRRELSGGSHPLPNSNDRMVVTKRESPPPMVMNDDEIETATIRDLLTQSKYDEATIKVRKAH
jgi:WD40 repeat protein